VKSELKGKLMKKKSVSILLVLAISSVFSLPAIADTQKFASCLVDSLTGKERKELAKWIYFAMAAHPEMSSFSKVSVEDRLNTDQFVGTLVTRLLADNCPSELRAAQRTDPLAINKAFELVGKVAMQELMADKAVTSAISNYAVFADQGKIRAASSDR